MRTIKVLVFTLICTSLVFGANYTFSNTTLISIPNSGASTPYPSNIVVSGVTGTVSNVSATLLGLTHTWPSDLDILLVSPLGSKVLLLSDAGGSSDVNNITISFADGYPAAPSSNLVSGTYSPTNFDVSDALPAPAPGGPYSAAMAVFAGANPNGSWSLFVFDDASGDVGTISSGWRLDVTAASASIPEPGTAGLFCIAALFLPLLRKR